eukprot:m.291567 g.291567  ORF g.291567 m.291567 type:complete len:811 (+) comp12489_c0_seq1:142-2574(+)
MSFRRLLEKATDERLLEPDLNLNLQVVDSIRQQDVSAKDAMREIRRRMLHKNTNISFKTLVLLEMVVKNCGAPIQAEIATAQSMTEMRKLIQHAEIEVRNKALELIQTWAHAFEREPAYKIVTDTYNDLRMRQHVFPEFNPEAEAMFVAERAPAWVEGDCCHRCRTKFTVILRRHHCRACGQIFCQKCSSKNSRIPNLGIEKEVRVCDRCYDQLKGNAPGTTGASANPDAALLSQFSFSELSPEEEVARAIAANPAMRAEQPSQSVRDLEQKEREEYELALALSLSEAENQKMSSGSAPHPYSAQGSAMYPSYASAPQQLYEDYSSDEDEDGDAMQQYLRRKTSSSTLASTSTPVPSAPMAAEPSAPTPELSLVPSSPLHQDDDVATTMESQLAALENKIRRGLQNGYDLNSDRTVQTLLSNLSKSSVALVEQMDSLDDERHRCLVLEEKNAHIEEMLEHLREQKRQHDAHLEQQRQEQELLHRMQLEQKMRLLEQQEREKREAEQRMAEERARQMQEAQQRMALEQERREQMFMRQAQQELQYPQASQPMMASAMPPAASYGGNAGFVPPNSQPYASQPASTTVPTHFQPPQFSQPQQHIPAVSSPAPVSSSMQPFQPPQHFQQHQSPAASHALPPAASAGQSGYMAPYTSLAPPAHNMPSSVPPEQQQHQHQPYQQPQQPSKPVPVSAVQSDLSSLFGGGPASVSSSNPSAAPLPQQFHSPMQSFQQPPHNPQQQPHQQQQQPHQQQQQQPHQQPSQPFQPPQHYQPQPQQQPQYTPYGAPPGMQGYPGHAQQPPHQGPIEANLISFD